MTALDIENEIFQQMADFKGFRPMSFSFNRDTQITLSDSRFCLDFFMNSATIYKFSPSIHGGHYQWSVKINAEIAESEEYPRSDAMLFAQYSLDKIEKMIKEVQFALFRRQPLFIHKNLFSGSSFESLTIEEMWHLQYFLENCRRIVHSEIYRSQKGFKEVRKAAKIGWESGWKSKVEPFPVRQ